MDGWVGMYVGDWYKGRGCVIEFWTYVHIHTFIHTGELVGPWCPFPPVLGTFWGYHHPVDLRPHWPNRFILTISIHTHIYINMHATQAP